MTLGHELDILYKLWLENDVVRVAIKEISSNVTGIKAN